MEVAPVNYPPFYSWHMAVPLRTTEASETWRALLSAFSGVNRILAEEMEAETALSLERYEILLMLSQAADGGMRPSELAERRHLSRSGATRLIERLELDGLVERSALGSDRRGSLVALTSEGERSFRTAGRMHLRHIDEHVGKRLEPDEMAELRRLLGKLGGAPTPAGVERGRPTSPRGSR